jgi:hypothetical protein
MCIVDFVLKFPNLCKTSISYDTHLKNLKLYKNRCGFTLSLYFGHIDLCCSWTMSLRVLEGPTYTVCMRRASLTSSLSNQTSISSHVWPSCSQELCSRSQPFSFISTFMSSQIPCRLWCQSRVGLFSESFTITHVIYLHLVIVKGLPPMYNAFDLVFLLQSEWLQMC